MDAAIKKTLAKLREEHEIDEGDDSIYTHVRELILDSTPIKTLSNSDGNLLGKLRNLTKLSMNGTGLTSLSNFPEIQSLKVLEMTDNHLSDTVVFSIIPKLFPNLSMLHLGGNHLKTLEDVRMLAQMKHLVSLGLALNPLAAEENYRSVVFSSIPSLQSLDQLDHTGVEHPDESDAEYYEDDEEEEDDVLKKFYEADYNSDDDLNDDEFIPEDGQEEDEDFFEEEEEEEEEGGAENTGEGSSSSIAKRVRTELDEAEPSKKKKEE